MNNKMIKNLEISREDLTNLITISLKVRNDSRVTRRKL